MYDYRGWADREEAIKMAQRELRVAQADYREMREEFGYKETAHERKKVAQARENLRAIKNR